MTPVHSTREAAPLPTSLAGFSKGKQLGQGAFGTVFLAFHKRTGDAYVMKEVELGLGLVMKEVKVRVSRDGG